MIDLIGINIEEKINDLKRGISELEKKDLDPQEKAHLNRLKRRLHFIKFINSFELGSHKIELTEILIEEIEFLENFERRFFKARGIRTHFIEKKANFLIEWHLELESWGLELLREGEIQEIIHPENLPLELECEVYFYRNHLNKLLLGISQNNNSLIINSWNEIVLLRIKYYNQDFIEKYCPYENFERIFYLLKKMDIKCT